MPEVLIEVDDLDLQAVAKEAGEMRRSRKAQLEWIIEDWVIKKLGKK